MRIDAQTPQLSLDVARETQAKPQASQFGERVEAFMGEVNASQAQADAAASAYANGQSNDIHGTMIAMQKADITLRLATNIRNRVIEAYREVMRMGA